MRDKVTKSIKAVIAEKHIDAGVKAGRMIYHSSKLLHLALTLGTALYTCNDTTPVIGKMDLKNQKECYLWNRQTLKNQLFVNIVLIDR